MLDNFAYFDNAATTFPKPECVYQAMDSFSRSCGVSLGRGQHRMASAASHIADETRELLLNLFYCSNKEVVFTNTATEAINIILNGLSLTSNSNVYISPFEHNAVTRVLHAYEKTGKIKFVMDGRKKDGSRNHTRNFDSVCRYQPGVSHGLCSEKKHFRSSAENSYGFCSRGNGGGILLESPAARAGIQRRNGQDVVCTGCSRIPDRCRISPFAG